jgi:hypothetical protein
VNEEGKTLPGYCLASSPVNRLLAETFSSGMLESLKCFMLNRFQDTDQIAAFKKVCILGLLIDIQNYR